jgi:hypothetical protein
VLWRRTCPASWVCSVSASSSATYRLQDERLCVCVNPSCDSGSPGSEALKHAKTIKKCNSTTNCNAPIRSRSVTSRGEYNLEGNRRNRGNYGVAVMCDPGPRHQDLLFLRHAYLTPLRMKVCSSMTYIPGSNRQTDDLARLRCCARISSKLKAALNNSDGCGPRNCAPHSHAASSKRFGRQRLNEIPGPCIYRTEQTAARILLR